VKDDEKREKERKRAAKKMVGGVCKPKNRVFTV
jgi:hypothetical protein